MVKSPIQKPPISLEELLTAKATKKYPPNLSRYIQHVGLQRESFQKVVRKFISLHKKGELDGEKFVFLPEMFQILKVMNK